MTTDDTAPLLHLEPFTDIDHDDAEQIARRLGYTQTAYTSTSALWGLFCLADRASQRVGCIIKTTELGLLFVQDLEDLKMYDLHNARLSEPLARRTRDREVSITQAADYLNTTPQVLRTRIERPKGDA